ncbi:MAG: DUF5320 domain-containing protein [Elusimicrobiota bacterium]
MPLGDGTGPAGYGPMTGRGAGYCAGYSVPGYMNPVGGRGYYGYGAGYRGGGFRGRGFGRRGWYAPVQTAWSGVAPSVPVNYGTYPVQEEDALEQQKEYLEQELKNIEDRLESLEEASQDK